LATDFTPDPQTGVTPAERQAAELREQQRRHEETKDRLLEAERIVSAFAAGQRGIDADPLTRFVVLREWDRLRDALMVLLKVERVLDREGERPAEKPAGKGGRRRWVSPRKPTPLTAEQAEAVQLVGEHKGNVSAAAKAAGKSGQAMMKLYGKAMKKLGQAARVFKAKTGDLPLDRHGQVNLSTEEDE
jgi:hypothetical protein